MDNLIATKELANQYLEISLKYNDLGSFLIGSPECELTLRDPNGEKVFSAMHVMEAIYDKYRENPNSGIDKQVFDSMIKELREEVLAKYILNLLEDIEYQLYCEKNNIAPFKLDCASLLKEVSENLMRNKDRFQKPVPAYPGYRGAWGEFVAHDKRVEDYGHKIL